MTLADDDATKMNNGLDECVHEVKRMLNRQHGTPAYMALRECFVERALTIVNFGAFGALACDYSMYATAMLRIIELEDQIGMRDAVITNLETWGTQ